MSARPLVTLALACALACALAACGGGGADPVAPPPPAPPTPPTPPATLSLRQVVEARHPRIAVGAAVGSRLTGTDATAGTFRTVLAREFNAVVAENAMKFDALQPSRGTYAWAVADRLLAFADSNRMKVRGHVLVWHSQAPAWFRTGTFTRAEAQQVMDDHITAVVGRYRGRIVAWDVVNEGFDDAAQFRTAQPVWERLGREYVARAFRTARAADPQAQLFYNDYNIEGPSRKADSTFALVRDLRAAGAPIDGIGMQAHFVVGGVPSKDQMLQNFARFAALGLKIHITELDVRVPTPASAADLERQAQHYRDVVDVCVQTPACEMIVTWGVSDLDSWVPGTFPGFGDALLFDRAFQAKPAYTAVRNFLNGQ